MAGRCGAAGPWSSFRIESGQQRPQGPQLAQALAVVGQRHQVPLTGHLVEPAARIRAKPRAALMMPKTGSHPFVAAMTCFGLGFLHRHLGLGRAEVVARTRASIRLGKRRDLVEPLSASTVAGGPSGRDLSRVTRAALRAPGHAPGGIVLLALAHQPAIAVHGREQPIPCVRSPWAAPGGRPHPRPGHQLRQRPQ